MVFRIKEKDAAAFFAQIKRPLPPEIEAVIAKPAEPAKIVKPVQRRTSPAPAPIQHQTAPPASNASVLSFLLFFTAMSALGIGIGYMLVSIAKSIIH